MALRPSPRCRHPHQFGQPGEPAVRAELPDGCGSLLAEAPGAVRLPVPGEHCRQRELWRGSALALSGSAGGAALPEELDDLAMTALPGET